MARPLPFPHRYAVTLSDGHLVAPPRAPIALGPPPQFGGTDRVWSPEELLLGAVLECLWTTFEAHARHDGLEVPGWSGTGVAVLDKGAPVPVFTSITLAVELAVAAADQDRARKLVATAEQRCIISNALKIPVTVELSFRPGS
ncbi:MAG: OsmC-like protein [Deltaproteobacteria bacterium]|nr:OsmC-like protein [Deltaproteobacteria bacterium]